MKTYYVGIIVYDYDDVESTNVFIDEEDCEDYCASITDHYYIVSLEVDMPSYSIH